MEVRRSCRRCRTAVCHAVVPSPMFCFQSRVGKCALENKTLQCNTSVLLSVFNKVSSTKPTQHSPGSFAPRCFSRLSITGLCVIATLHFCCILHVPFSSHFQKAKTVKASHLCAVDEKGQQLGKAANRN